MICLGSQGPQLYTLYMSYMSYGMVLLYISKLSKIDPLLIFNNNICKMGFNLVRGTY